MNSFEPWPTTRVCCANSLSLLALCRPVITIAYAPTAGFVLFNAVLGNQVKFYTAPAFWFDCGGFCLPHNAISRQYVLLKKRSKMLAVCVDFEIDPAALAAFLPLMQKNAAESLANEAGCHQFDITQDPQNPTKIFLYELYDNAAEFEAHKQARHFLEFNDATSGMITAKSVRLLQKISH